MAKIAIFGKCLLFLMVLELAMIISTEGKAWWGRRRRSCSSERPKGVAWANNWKDYFIYSCPNSYSLRRWYSIHRNCKEDRIHSFQCRYGPVGPVAYHACSWTHHFVNDYDRPVIFKCNQNGFLTGVKSEYSHHHKDRRFGFRCCHKPGYYQHYCKWTPILNDWDGVLNYYVPYGYSLVGVHSYHHNHYEDRRWKFEICKITKP